uniref:Olfactomedin-like 3a n=1 Tax=Hucho hucho TaxID=62062 RepID=A0A4W5RRM6_9TELE
MAVSQSAFRAQTTQFIIMLNHGSRTKSTSLITHDLLPGSYAHMAPQSNRYNSELRHFKKQTAEFIKGLNHDHGTLCQHLEGTGTQNPVRACVNQADRMVDVDQEVKKRVKERVKERVKDRVKEGKAKKIIKDINHPSHDLFTPLSSSRPHQYWCIKAGTERLKTASILRPSDYSAVTDSALFPVEVADHRPVYSLNPETALDMAADEEGLWMVQDSLDIEQMWDTQCPRENAEAAFMVCGTGWAALVYVVYNTREPSRSRMQCVFDVNDMVTSEEAPLLYQEECSSRQSEVQPSGETDLCLGQCYQILYKLSMKRKLTMIP